MTVRQHCPALAERDGGWLCHYCGAPLSPTDEREHESRRYFDDRSYTVVLPYRFAQADHKIAKSRGGTDDLANLVLACDSCNCRKGARLYEEFVLEVHP